MEESEIPEIVHELFRSDNRNNWVEILLKDTGQQIDTEEEVSVAAKHMRKRKAAGPTAS